jgi:hypothetical protein
MSSSTSSSEPAAWRRFFALAAGSAALAALIVYGFVVLVDPWGMLPLSLPLPRVPVTSNQRFSYPMLARSPAFDSAIIGTSTTRLLRPVALDPAFHARFVNLAMNDATAWEMSEILHVFTRTHPDPKIVMVGIDVRWCVTGDPPPRLTPRPFPRWMYRRNRWAGYGQMLNLFAVQEAGKQFGVVTGLKRPDMGSDGYTSFVPPDDTYDAGRAMTHLRAAGPEVPPGARSGPPESWRYPTLEMLHADLAALPADTRKILFFVPYNHRLFPPPGSETAAVWDQCRAHLVAIGRAVPHTSIIDFMRPSPITETDTNYWDPLHYRITVADKLAHDLADAEAGEPSPDYRVLLKP